MSNPPIPPALSDKEWLDSFGAHNHDTTHGERSVYIACDEAGETRHALAALCLHGQPFGFDQDDVELLRTVAAGIEAHPRTDGTTYGELQVTETAVRSLVESLADRIQALLPPHHP